MLHLRADREHVRERALRDDEMPLGVASLGHHDRQALPEEVVGDLVNLPVAGGRQPRLLARRDDRRVDRVVDAGLEGGVEKRELPDGGRRASLRIGGVGENNRPFGQRAGLVGAEDGHAPQVLDRVQAADDDALLAHGPRAGRERDAHDRGQELGREADGEGDREEQRLDKRTVEQEIHRQDGEDDDDHRPDQQVAELPESAGEVGFGLSRAQPCGDRAERRAPPRVDDEDSRRAAAHRRPEKHDVRPPGERRVGGYDSGLLLHRERLAGHAGLADEEVPRLEDPSVRGNQVTRREHEDVAGHEHVGAHGPFDAVAHHAAGEREALLQLLDRRGRPVLLVEAEQRGANHDREDDRRVDPLGEAERDRGGEDQDEDERALDLPPEQAQRAETLSVLHAVWADDSESLGGARRREPVRTRAKGCAEVADVATPVRCGGVRDAHAASHSSPERIRSIWRVRAIPF